MTENILENAKTLDIHKNKPIIYFLFKGNVIVYIGKTNSLLQRIGCHTKDKDFDTARIIYVDKEDQDQLEQAFIKTYVPKYNNCKNFKISKTQNNLLKKYNYDIGISRKEILDLPAAKYYGQVAVVLDDGEILFGLYDNDVSALEIDEHEDGCDYAYIEEGINEFELHEEVLNEMVSLIPECKCSCPGQAVVYLKGEKNYLYVDGKCLRELPDEKRFDKFQFNIEDLGIVFPMGKNKENSICE